MQIPFHPLAELFPLIEGSEFDELAYSILQHGLREPITLFDGMILDGRNRYRACEAVSVEPRFETFTGNDLHAFVADKNIHRRHLNETQRAMIAGRMANLTVGNPNLKHAKSPITEISVIGISATKAAALMNVSDDMVGFAKTVLKEGTEAEVKAVETGKAAVSTIAKQIRNRVPPDDRNLGGRQGPVAKAAHAQRISTTQANAKLYASLKEAIILINDLPRPADMAVIARKIERGGLIDAKLFSTIQYLKEFAHEWSKRNQTSAQAADDSDGDDHAGNGNGTSGAERA